MSHILDRIGSRVVIASVSGGKDSTAMCLHLRELGIEHRRVFADTGWEHASTYDHIRGELTRVLGPIDEVSGPLPMADLIRARGTFPSRVRRFCTTELKVFPLSRHHIGLDEETINAVGIRAEESEARAAFTEWEYSDTFGGDTWRPILAWSLDDVIAIHKRHGVAPNPNYLEGASRVGCKLCIHSKKDDIRLVAEKHPEVIDEIEALEAEVTAAANERERAQGKPLTQRAWFQVDRAHRTTEKFEAWPIRKVVEWSKTKRGGGKRSLELFASHNDGCARWGMCESSPREAEAVL